jgi:hypothetical protein
VVRQPGRDFHGEILPMQSIGKMPDILNRINLFTNSADLLLLGFRSSVAADDVSACRMAPSG